VRGSLGKAYLEIGQVAEGTELMEAASFAVGFIIPATQEITPIREVIDEARGQ
jgi:hypothetical protein